MTLYTYVTVRYGFYSCGKRQKITREEEEKRIVIETEKRNREIKEDNERRKEDNERRKEDDESRKEHTRRIDEKTQESIAMAEKKRLDSKHKREAIKILKLKQKQENKQINAALIKATANVAAVVAVQKALVENLKKIRGSNNILSCNRNGNQYQSKAKDAIKKRNKEKEKELIETSNELKKEEERQLVIKKRRTKKESQKKKRMKDKKKRLSTKAEIKKRMKDKKKRKQQPSL